VKVRFTRWLTSGGGDDVEPTSQEISLEGEQDASETNDSYGRVASEGGLDGAP
jgi:hypothetical protein